MNICHVVESLDPAAGGPARSVPSLGAAVHEAGANVQLYINKKSGQNEAGQATAKNHLPVYPIQQLNKAVQAFSATKQKNTIIHSHGIWLPLNHHASVTAKRRTVPLIISPRGMLEPWARSYRSWKKAIAWNLYQRRDLGAASVLHATSVQEAKNLQALGLNIPIVIIANGVDAHAKAETVEHRNNQKTALFLSRIHPIKGLINLVRAWAEVRPDNWQVIVAGPDEDGYQKEVEHELQRYTLSDAFKFIGSVSDQDKWQHYASADLFILPSHSENFGIVVAEALASGTPVITTTGTPWEELKIHSCGWWIDIGVAPLAEAIRQATQLPPEERRVMGLRGRALIKQNYSWDTIGKEMFSVYEWMIRGGTPPNCIFDHK